MKKRNILKIVLIVLLSAVAVAAICLVLLLRIQHTDTSRLPERYPGSIPVIISSIDMDGDGIDDQSDILQGALTYVETRPKYESRYYAGGFPDDGYGVCTDVVVNALLAAGYNLKELVQKDIKENPAGYNIEIPDENIDFRRVRNLKVFFDHTAVSLTADIHEIEEWQGGDIVVFNNHIGIVSDRRNADGITYVIHHDSPLQVRYEEDLFSRRSDIIGHYRMSE